MRIKQTTMRNALTLMLVILCVAGMSTQARADNSKASDPGLGIDAALEEIERNKGKLFDLAVADACVKLFRERGYVIPN